MDSRDELTSSILQFLPRPLTPLPLSTLPPKQAQTLPHPPEEPSTTAEEEDNLIVEDLPGAVVRSGAQLQRYAHLWQQAPHLVRTTVTRGYHWEWATTPPPLHLPQSTQRAPQLAPHIQDWVQKQVIVPVPLQHCHLSRVFLVPKKDCPLRLIIDLSQLNNFIVAPPFSIDNHAKVARIMIPPVHMASIDIREAYTHIPMRPNL